MQLSAEELVEESRKSNSKDACLKPKVAFGRPSFLLIRTRLELVEEWTEELVEELARPKVAWLKTRSLYSLR